MLENQSIQMSNIHFSQNHMDSTWKALGWETRSVTAKQQCQRQFAYINFIIIHKL